METSFIIHELKLALNKLLYGNWLTREFASPQWWGIVVIIVVAYAIWWLLVDKRRLFELLFFGSCVAVARILTDITASGAGLYSYSIRLVPLSPDPFLHEFTLTPLSLMLVHQHSRSWRTFIAASAVVCGVICFVLLPLFSIIGILRFYNWNYFFSFISIFVVACFSRAVVMAVSYFESLARQSETAGARLTGPCQPALKPLAEEVDNEEK